MASFLAEKWQEAPTWGKFCGVQNGPVFKTFGIWKDGVWILFYSNGRKWYEIVLSERERKLARLEAMRKQKEDQELAECTFKPSIHGKSAKGTPRLTPANQAQARVARQPTVVEEEKHELHGFIFQEASPQEHDCYVKVDFSNNMPKKYRHIVSFNFTAVPKKQAL
eukprot:Gb_12710 [translate_table: standard]